MLGGSVMKKILVCVFTITDTIPNFVTGSAFLVVS